ncbi:MAG: M23 family metallopeptidase [Treponema sp.]|nr:M23 family metallopeptidase [Treponema sp.]
MAAIIENQRVCKRRKVYSSGSGNKSASFNTGFMSQFKQHPVQTRRKNSSPLFSFRVFSRNTVKPRNTYKKPVREKQEFKKGTGSGFSFPVPSIATLAVISGTVVIALAALNWEGIEIRTPDIYAFELARDETAEQRIIQYASTGIAGISLDTPPAEQTAVINEAAEIDNPHGMLVTFEWRQYRVKRGDSVSGIAQKHGVSVGAIIASNDISNARRLQEGAILRVPNVDGIPYKIQRGDSLSRIAVSFNVPLEVILDINDIKSDNIIPGETLFIPGARMNDIDLRMSLGELFMFPLPGRRHITSNFGMRKDPIAGHLQFHDGVDFRANIGTTVMASLDGVVEVTGENWLYGKYIILRHSNGYKTLYGHLNSFSVKQGDRVARGRKIGESGNTGYSTGPHLHFGVYGRNGKEINPLELLN